MATVLRTFQCPLKGSPSICITREGEVWLGGDESRELVMVNNNGQELGRREIRNRPYSLAVMDCDDIIISPRHDDSRSVSKLLRRNDEEQDLNNAYTTYSAGVSVTADQKILICTYDWEVRMINSDGTNVRNNDGTFRGIIYRGRGGFSTMHAVEKADGNIYISDRRNQAVVMVTNEGEELTITHTTEEQRLGPLGLVVDKMNNVLCADLFNDCVYIIDQHQQMRELVGPSHGIKKPCWLAVDNDRNLWITQNDGKVLVVKYLFP